MFIAPKKSGSRSLTDGSQTLIGRGFQTNLFLQLLNLHQSIQTVLLSLAATIVGLSLPDVAMATPNGTWLSQPQIRFHASNNTLDQVMATIKSQNYKVVFLDFRNVSDAVQQQVSQSARQHQLYSIIWVQSPQYRSLTVPQLVHEARYGDGIQVDDHFFSNYSAADFYALRSQYNKPIFCSIQPFQAKQVPTSGCDQLDVQCYVSNNFQNCLKLADRLKAVVSLSSSDTYRHSGRLGSRTFNVFLWPYSSQFLR
jgi:hypothetical protein